MSTLSVSARGSVFHRSQNLYDSPYTYNSNSKATKFVDTYVEGLRRSGYSTAEITNALINLRSTYVKRQKSNLYSGTALTEIENIIDELDTAIAGVSGGNCSTCSVYDPFLVTPPRDQYNNVNYYNNGYNSNYNSNNSNNTTYYNPYSQNQYNYPYSKTYYNTYSPPNYSNYGIASVSAVTIPIDTYSSTQTRVDLTHSSTYTNAYRDYDVYTFIQQTNAYNNSQPYSNQFIATSITRTLSTAQGRTIAVSFGNENDSSRVQNIRNLANNATKTSQTTYNLSSNMIDTYTSLGADDFNRQAIATGANRLYRLYKLYIARDNSEAFVVEYLETGTSTLNRNILWLDTNSFVDNGSYFSHSYRADVSKRYKNYLYIPAAGSNSTNVYNILGISGRSQYQAGTTRSQYVNAQYTSTAINGYTVNLGSIGALESVFAGYVNPSYIILPGSNAQITFAPLTNYSFQYARLSDNTYRAYRLLVAEDNSDAYITEYIENQPN